ncbi:MAG TPA: ATP-binding protein [Candidatus Saccharimonadia bacterium]|nr:ATP-binding protein [Candidatus Saccharimonadia bacterium]
MGTSGNEQEELLQTALRNAGTIVRERARFERELLDARDTLREREERLRATFDQAAIGIAVATLDGGFVEANRKFEQFLGYGIAELKGKGFLDLTHPDDVAETRVLVEQLLRGEIPEYTVEKRYIRKDGSTVWSRTKVTLLRNAQGQPERFIGAVENITERRLAEAALREETRVLELLNSTSASIAATLDLEALVQTVTDVATKLTGAAFGAFFYTETSKDGESFMLYTLSGAPREAFSDFGHPRATALFGPTFHGEPPIRIDDVHDDPRYGQSAPHHGMPPGHLPVRSYLAVPVISRSGAVIGGLFFGHPQPAMFSERSERLACGIAAQAAIGIDNARLYDEVRRAAHDREHLLTAEREARTQAERASRLKDDFLATLSHELRTPLNAILGWSQILSSGKANEAERQRGSDAIVRNARAQAQLIEDLLDMSRIMAGKVRLDAQPVDPAGIIDAAFESARPAADARGVHLSRIVDPRVGPVTGDPHRLQQIVWNLLTNAVKFTPKGGRVSITLRRVESSVEITVADTGIGISPEFLPHVFDRFRQADASTTRTHGGLGLGLSIVRNLVELHGGTVRAESSGVGFGSRFVVKLPLAALSPSSTLVDQSEIREPAAAPVFDLTGRRILVVDDEPDARDMLRQLLSGYGAIVTIADSAERALQSIARELPDLIVTDIGMPEQDGYQFVRTLRRLPPAQGGRVPAIALTAFARSEDRTRAMMAGFQLHVAKPIEPSELLAAVQSLSRDGRAD